MPEAYAGTIVKLHRVFSFRFQPVNGVSSGNLSTPLLNERLQKEIPPCLSSSLKIE